MLGRLTINTTQSCNLDCVYCYAEGGDYGGVPLRLSSETAIKALGDVTRKHNQINFVQFIGGEPLLNLPVMYEICSELDYFVQQGILIKMPKIAAVTNLTVLSDKHIVLFKKYDFDLTISLDGPVKIHDRLRPCKNKNSGTHDTITRNIDKISNANISYNFEATYTRLHYEENITFINLLNYFMNWNPGSIDIIMVALPKNDPNGCSNDFEIKEIIKWQIAAIDFCIDKLYSGEIIPYGLFRDTVSLIISEKKHMDDYCPAEKSNLAISADGKIYGCHMFTNQKQHLLDLSDNIGNSLRSDQSQDLSEIPIVVDDVHKKLPIKADANECKTCWARQWCRVCIGNMEIRSQNGDLKPKWFNCELNKKSLQTVLQQLPAALDSLTINH